MKKRILIVADNARRDLVATRLLQRAFQKRGADARLSTLLDLVLNLRRFKPHALMICRGDLPVAKQASECTRVYIFPGEGAQLTKETMLSVFMGRSYWKLESVAWIRRCYLWSEHVRNSLLETGMFKSDQLNVVGSCRLDVYRHHLRQKRFPRRPEDFVLGVAISAKTTSAYFGKPHCAESYFDFHPQRDFPVTPPGRHFEDICWRDHAILRLSMRYLKRYLHEFSGKVIVRPSPLEDAGEFRFLEKRYPGRVTLSVNVPMIDFLESIDTLLTCWSTSGLEALIMGVPTISVAGTQDQEYLFQHMDRRAIGFDTYVPFYYLPSSEDGLMALISKAQNQQLPPSPKTRGEVIQILKYLYNWPYEQPAHELIAEDVINDLNDAKENPDSKWCQALPIPHGIPVFLAPLAYWMRNQYNFYHRGAFRQLRDFYSIKNPRIELLIKRMEREAVENPKFCVLCWK